MTRPPILAARLLALAAGAALAAVATPAAPQGVSRRPTPDIFGSHRQIVVSTAVISDSGTSPDFTITARVPAFTDADDRRAEPFGAELREFVQGLIADFKREVAKSRQDPARAANSLDVRFGVVSPPGDLVSIKFETETRLAGAARPSRSTHTFTYDLETGRDVVLHELFAFGRDYLGPISRYCAAQLGTRDIGFREFSQGADPMPENYRNWNVTGAGLMITFDEGQVAPYLAGPQVVTVPYNFLSDVIDQRGPLAITLIRGGAGSAPAQSPPQSPIS